MLRVQNVRSLSFLLILALLLAAPWPAAAMPFDAPRSEATAGPIRLFVECLASLWSNNGCSFDPGGSCQDTVATESPAKTNSLDNGCSFDPDGSPCRGNG